MTICCPNWKSTETKKNGHIHNAKQNHCCKACRRQFVENPKQKLISSFYTDDWQAYKGVTPAKRHHVVKGKTNHIERFNCTMRQRISRLVRKALSFSEKLKNHIGAIKYFICHYNLRRASHV